MARVVLVLLVLSVGVPAIAQDPAAPTADYFVEAVVDNPMPFVGQQVTYTLRLYHAVELENLLFQAAEFQGFSRAEVDAQEGLAFTRSAAAVVEGRQYQVSDLDTILFPLRTGDIEIAPSALVLGETVFRDEQRLETNPVLVRVQPLPEGVPEGFNGAVGRFELAATLDRQSVTLGEPVMLRLTITGAGNFDQLIPPELPVPDAWRVYDNPPEQNTGITGGLLVGEKTFEWLIIPSETGSQTLPEITLDFFDPDTLAYRSVSTSPVTLEIFPPDGDVAQSPLALAEPPRETVMTLKPVAAIAQPVPLNPGFGFWSLWLLPPAAAMLSGWWAVQQRRKRADHVKIRQSSALRRAQEHLDIAQKMRSNDACRVISEAVYLYFAEKLNRAAAGLNQVDVQYAMDARQINGTLEQRVMNCLEWADEGRYAPVDSVNIQSLLKRTAEALSVLDTAWKVE